MYLPPPLHPVPRLYTLYPPPPRTLCYPIVLPCGSAVEQKKCNEMEASCLLVQQITQKASAKLAAPSTDQQHRNTTKKMYEILVQCFCPLLQALLYIFFVSSCLLLVR